ncbi:MAG: DUF5313 family protein [Nocardiopsaceae bacterium]|nr:DUF5313 family protein [Nocardiopsaceae bacterium]
MGRIPGDPNAVRWVLFAVGFRLPPENREWVRHELTDAGWRGRTVRRLLVPLVPICVVLSFLPGPTWLRIMVPALALITSVGTVLISADDLRTARLRQHGLPAPLDKDLNRPPH